MINLITFLLFICGAIFLALGVFWVFVFIWRIGFYAWKGLKTISYYLLFN